MGVTPSKGRFCRIAVKEVSAKDVSTKDRVSFRCTSYLACAHIPQVITSIHVIFISILSACFILSLVGCAASTPSTMEVAGLDEGESAVSSEEEEGEQSSYGYGSQDQIGEMIALSSLEDGVAIEVRAENDQVDLVVRSMGEAVDYQITRLEENNRIQVSLPNESLIQGANNEPMVMIPEQNGIVTQVALKSSAVTSEGIVVEFALNKDIDVAYESEPVAGNLYVTLMAENSEMDPNQMDPSVGMAEDVKAMPSDEMMAEANSEQAAPSQENLAAAPVPMAPELQAVSFQKHQDYGQVVIAEMNAAGVFSLQKTAPSEYVLRLEDASFDPGNIQTLIAPPNSNVFRSVRAVAEGKDTLLRIFADPSATIAAATRGSNIIIHTESASPYLAPNADSDIRAQAELDEAVENEEVEVTGEESVDELTELESEISSLLDEAPKYTGRKISLDLQDTDIDNALRIIAEVSNLNIIASDDVQGKVTLRLIDVPWDQALDVILKTNGLDKVLEGNVMRIAPIDKLRSEREALKLAREAEEELEALVVKYIRVSYAKAAELRPLVESVLSERGTVTYDDRTNQLIVKDIRRGVKNVAELVARLDLRTPQVLLETQIVEAERSFFRSVGSELGFSFIRSPETGNPTGKNFPNSIEIGGAVPGTEGDVGVAFPAAGLSATEGSAVSILLDSADGSRSIDYALTALETEGQIRIVSRPSVATTNNKQAIIRSIEKIRVKTPAGGLSVATGSGASAQGSGGVATETIEIGIILEVTPQASPDYFVLLDINAKSSTFGSEEVDGIPSEVERSATSTVLVSSGQTFAMGGIYKITDNDTISGVPFLKDIPFLGHLFRRTTVQNSDEELIFFITPRIIEGSFDDAAMKLSS